MAGPAVGCTALRASALGCSDAKDAVRVSRRQPVVSLISKRVFRTEAPAFGVRMLSSQRFAPGDSTLSETVASALEPS